MGCCGKFIRKGFEIVNGNVLYFADKNFNLPREKYKYADGRIAICRDCEKQTWLTRREYFGWLKDNGIDVLKNIDQLEKLPDLPAGDRGQGRNLFCKICKCFIPAKAYVEDEKCPLDKWR